MRQSVFLLQPRGEAKQILQPAARHHDVLVQLGQAGVAQRIGKFAAQFPDGLALLAAEAVSINSGLMPRARFFATTAISWRTEFSWPSSSTMRCARQPLSRLLLVRSPAAASVKASATSSAQGRNPAARMARIVRTASFMEPKPTARQARNGGSGSSFKRRLGDHAQHAFRADEQPREIKAGLVLVRAPAEPRRSAVRQHHFQAQHIIARDAVFQAARAAGVGGDVAADGAIRAAGGIGRIKQPALFDRLLQMLR